MFILYRQKSYKRDKQLRRVESVERADNISNAAKDKYDYQMVNLISMENFKDKTLYHSTCIANYMPNWKREPAGDASNESEHAIAFKNLTEVLHDNLFFE